MIKWYKDLLEEIKTGFIVKFYKGSQWINKRKDIIKRDNNECQVCKANGGYHRAECVHHIKHLKEYPELALEDSNLVSLCNTCHNLAHPEKLNITYKPKYHNKERW